MTLVAKVLVVSFGTPWGMGTSSWKSSVSSWTRQRVAASATRLVAGLEQMAAAAGARRAVLQTGGNQPEAEALYPKIG